MTPSIFGTAWSCVTGLSMPSRMVSGFRVVGEAIARRWLTPRGALIDDPNYGWDFTDLLGQDLSARDLAMAGAALQAEAQKDERVQRAQVQVTLSAIGVLSASGIITTSQGPFTLVLSVSQVTPATLTVSPA